VGGAPADKPARLVAPGDAVVVAPAEAIWASRGGFKLDAALTRWQIVVEGRRCLDAGASTGGFTDVLLSRGATEVWAVDVGRGQLLDRLRRDPRVVAMDRTNIRLCGPADLGGGGFDVVVADLSFISLRTVAPMLAELAAPGADLVWLVKPQFEAGRDVVSAGKGVVRDPSVWRAALLGVGHALVSHGAAIMGVMTSPLRGADGNVEFVLWARAATPSTGSDIDALVAGALSEVDAP
jgi:23S rRNA (cytidine1920-2'-O)/16S rRNA (cytidine1409-2'-O)-methyltransferase